jgi:hypothetical protein
MYFVKLNNRKVSIKLFAKGFKTYEEARQALRKLIRSKGHDSNLGYTHLGYVISKGNV